MNTLRLRWFGHNIWRSAPILAVVFLAGCEAEETTKAAPPPPKIVVADVTVGDVPITYDFAGTVKSVRLVEIVPRVSGEVIERPFDEGSVVQKGDVLYQIDHRPFQAQLDNNSALLEQAQADVGFWTAEVERYSQASQSGAVSKQEVDSAKTQLQNAQAQVKQYDAEIREAELDLEYSTIRAPLTGRILQSRLYEGSIASAYESEPTSVIQLDPVHVVFNVSRVQSEEIQTLMSEGLAGSDPYKDFVVEVFNADGRPFKYKGKIDFLSFLINSTTDTMTARAEFKNPTDERGETLLVPGQYVPVKVTVGSRPDQVLIPGPSVLEGEAGSSVYVYDKSKETVDTRRIKTVGLTDQGWVVTDGLKQGDTVVTSGLLKVRPGIKVSATTAGAADDASGESAGSEAGQAAGDDSGSGSGQSTEKTSGTQ